MIWFEPCPEEHSLSAFRWDLIYQTARSRPVDISTFYFTKGTDVILVSHLSHFLYSVESSKPVSVWYICIAHLTLSPYVYRS